MASGMKYRQKKPPIVARTAKVFNLLILCSRVIHYPSMIGPRKVFIFIEKFGTIQAILI